MSDGLHYPMQVPAFGISGFPADTAEHLAMIAMRHADENTMTAVQRLRDACNVLIVWQRIGWLEGDVRDDLGNG